MKEADFTERYTTMTSRVNLDQIRELLYKGTLKNNDEQDLAESFSVSCTIIYRENAFGMAKTVCTPWRHE
jgi:hypothetical protein